MVINRESRKAEELCNDEEKELLEAARFQHIIEEYVGEEKDTLCGIGACKNGPIQHLAKPAVYLIVSSVIALIQGLFSTYSNATLSTVEKDFGLTSKLSGLTTTGNDVIQLLISLPLPYFAGRGHRPRWLAFGMMLSALGCFVAVLPHFILESARSKDNQLIYHSNYSGNMSYDSSSEWCNNETRTKENCGSVEEKLNNLITSDGVVWLLLIAQMLAGVASLLYYTIGYSYLDEAVAKETVPLFLSIAGAMRLLGPVCGYSLASWALSIWKDPFNEHVISIKRSHPQWIGAWWLGYIVIGSLLLGMSWVLVFLPKTLPSTRKRRLRELQAMAKLYPQNFYTYISSLRSSKPRLWKDMFPSLRRLASNDVYRLVNLKQVIFWFAFFGYITFKSKYLEHQFRLSAAEANKYIAAVSLLAAIVGWLGTGASLSFFKPKAKTVILYMAFLTSVSCVCHVVQLQIYCDHPTMEGLDAVLEERNPGDFNSSAFSECEVTCGCLDSKFSPVCLTATSTSYFSSCFARCQQNSHLSTNKYIDDENLNYNLENGFCPPNCPTFVFYLVISVMAKMAHAASRVPANILLLRCVEERDKDMGLGLFNALTALGASIPAPILFGWAIDSVCNFWNESCGKQNACWIYNVDSFRSIVHGIPAAFLFLGLIVDLLLLKHHNKLELYSDPALKENQIGSKICEEKEVCL